MEEKRDHKIYKYTNKINGKVYIGRTCQSLSERACGSGSGYRRCTYFWRAIQKYGWENFEGEVIEEGLNDSEATQRELFWMEKYQSRDRDKGYNISDSSLYISDECRKKHCEQTSGVNNPMWHYQYTEEQRERMRQASLGEKNPFYGKHHTEETKRIISEKKKEYYKAHSGTRLGQKVSKESREKMSKSRKGKYCGKDSPRYGIKHTEESKRKMSEHKKGQIAWNRIKVRCVETGRVFESAGIAGREMHLDNSAILKCCKDPKKTCGGYHWEYVDR